VRRYWLSLSALVGLLLLPVSASGFGYRIDPFQWRLEWNADDPQPHFHFTIWNTQVGGSNKALAYQERTHGINLGWGNGRSRSGGRRQWFFTAAEAIEPSHKLGSGEAARRLRQRSLAQMVRRPRLSGQVESWAAARVPHQPHPDDLVASAAKEEKTD
jgi:hypothetical protein